MWFYFVYFYSTGIRRMEPVNRKIHDLDFTRGTTATIFDDKGKKDHVVPVGDRACAWIRKYLEEVRSTLVADDDNGHVFLTECGEPFFKNRMNDLVNKYMDAVGIDKPGACHLFRHAMAIHMLKMRLTFVSSRISWDVNLSSTEI